MTFDDKRKYHPLFAVLILLILTGCANMGSTPPSVSPTELDRPTPVSTLINETHISGLTNSGDDQNHEKLREKDGAIIILIPEGEFLMGCDIAHNAGFECRYNQLPLHSVYLSAYYMDKHEVTNGQYKKCVEAGRCKEPVYKNSLSRDRYYGNPAFSGFPVVAITWFEANTYCEWVGGRLPTEAEWEKAARGTSIKAYPWGDQNPNCDLANSYDNASGDVCVGDTVKVGSYPDGASVYGVMDMAGNVWEWVEDWYHPDYYHKSPLVDPPGDESGVFKIIRGGSFDYSWSKLLIAYKSNHRPSKRHLGYGFRCVSPIEE